MKTCGVVIVLCAVFASVVGVSRNRTKFQAQKPKPLLIDDDYCFDNPDVELAPHQDCTKFWGCDAIGAFPNDCPPGEIFDTELLFCGKI